MALKFLITQKHRLRNLYDFSRAEHRSWKPGTPIRPDLLARGFLSDKGRIYPFSKYPTQWFLSDWELLFRLSKVNGHISKSIFNNKLFYHLALQKIGYGDFLPPLIGLATPGGFTSYSDFATLEEALEQHPSLFMKPMDGNAGRGVFVMPKERANSIRFPAPYLAETIIAPHPYAWKIFPFALNTIRLTVLRDPRTNRFFVLNATHRFGSKASAPADNFSQGGLAALVDVQTGVLARAKSAFAKSPDEDHATHPDTGAAIEGVKIPHWDTAKALALEVADRFTDLRVMGWDLAITHDGPRLVEGNAGIPAITLTQLHQPLLLDKRARDFLAHHGVISRRKTARLERESAAFAKRTDSR